MEVRKITGFVLSSVEVADDYAGLGDHVRGVLDGTIVLPPTRDAGPNSRWQALLAAAETHAPLAELVKLHEPHGTIYPKADGMPPYIDWRCHGEEPNGYDAEWADWPCETTAIIARHLGVDVANDPDHH